MAVTVPRTQRDAFLDTMDSLLPWPTLCAIVQPNLEARANTERMLRICLLQSWFGLSDRDCADALIDSIGLQRFARIDAERDGFPDARAIREFRGDLQSRERTQPLAAEVNRVLATNGIRVKPGAIVNARIFADAPGRRGETAPKPVAGKPATRPSFGGAYGRQSMHVRLARDAGQAAAERAARLAQAIFNVRSVTEG
ncbi:transposase [Caballeronia sp. GAFFF1]|uniref:transposase n=1 Tax=Caballeronia sp. GAFFF1 TaxID=2921779 RepID=UPI002027A6E8|nr:transposase [Caballeronia sp. GAFFF1]